MKLVVTLAFFFFFQAEDGIRDKLVTGVQTCALPISEQESHFGTGFLDVILQRLDLGAPECGLLPPAGDQRPPLPRRSAHYTFEFKEIAALGLGQRRAPMDTQLADVEPDLSELAHDEDLKGLGCELRQFQRRPPLSSPSLSRGHYGTGAGAARPG